MRVLHVVAGKLFGGVEATLLTRTRFRDTFPEMESEFAVCFEGQLSQQLRAAGATVYVLGEVRTRYPYTLWRGRRRLRDLLRRQSYDIVMCHLPWAQAIFGPVVRSVGMPLAFGSHGPVTGRSWIERWAATTRPDIAICLSRFLVANVANMFPGVPAHVVYNAVAPGKPMNSVERAAVRAEVNTPADAVVVVQAGRMEPGKGQDVCLDALRLLRDLPGWECWQIGGTQRPEEHRLFESLRERAITSGIAERIRFWGWRADVPRLLAAADIYCQPNDTFLEGLGSTFIEAMTAGLPVITSGIGAAPEVVDENCGFLQSPGDSAGVAETLKKLICDPGLRARLGAGAKLRAEAQFSPPVQIRTLCEALGTAIRPVRFEASGSLTAAT